MQPLVSIVIPCYNHENYIEDSIQSIIDQTYARIELIVIDDGSKDQSVEKIQAMLPVCEQRFERVYFNTRPNKGLCATLNEALALCYGTFVSIIASDDLMLAEKIQLQVNYASAYPEVTSFYGGVQLIDFNGEISKVVHRPLEYYTFESILTHNFVLYAPTQFHRLKDVVEIGGFDPNVKIEDWDFLLRLTHSGKKVICIPELLSAYRTHDENMSGNMDFMCTEVLKVLDKYKEHRLYKKAKYEVLKQYKLKPIKRVSKVKYYFFKYYFQLQLLFEH
jgi:glycosyltransferase involved in cell wall biosynthesis